MILAEKMMFEGDSREEFDAWMEEMKGTFIRPNSGAPMVIEEVVELKDIEFE
tara:strand:- start:5142 stop:5297 length:156 start_codon:yes stop_codon:yes gene_type:complete